MSDWFPPTPGNVGPAVQGLGDLVRSADASDSSWADGSWWQQLQPGSWRGVPFVLDTAQNKMGRRVVVHEYAYRDSVWAEDLGKLPPRFGLQVFLTGDGVYQLRDRMIAACEQKGAGTLVHPTLGSMQVVCLDFDCIDRRDRGRYVEVTLAFVASGEVRFPSSVVASGPAVLQQAARLMPAATGDLTRTLASLPVLPTIDAAARSVAQFSGMAVSAVNDATRAFNAVRGLAGNFGRFAGGKRGTVQLGTVTSAISKAISTRATVLRSAENLISLGNRL